MSDLLEEIGDLWEIVLDLLTFYHECCITCQPYEGGEAVWLSEEHDLPEVLQELVASELISWHRRQNSATWAGRAMFTMSFLQQVVHSSQPRAAWPGGCESTTRVTPHALHPSLPWRTRGSRSARSATARLGSLPAGFFCGSALTALNIPFRRFSYLSTKTSRAGT